MKSEVKKGAQTVMKGLLTTNESPYKMSLYMPALLNRIYRDMDKYEVTVEHKPGKILDVITITNNKHFKNFKIIKTGNGDEKEIEVNGIKFLLTGQSLQAKSRIPLARGHWIKPKITWQGRLPINAREAEAFLLQNRLNVEVKGSRRYFTADLGWKRDRPNNPPWNCEMNFNIAGKGPIWGTYSISRDVTAAVVNNVTQLSVSGDASFTKGVFAKISPFTTDIQLEYLMNAKDLVGKLSTVIKGLEYSVGFPSGSSVGPRITWGKAQ